MGQYYVYILASKRNGTLYIGVTNNLLERIHQHKEAVTKGFAHRYNVHNLVYYEVFNRIQDAITREKRMKKWNRAWKIELIEKSNPNWEGLFDSLST
ncbi:MAG: GIY-YIG nuclease family protein [Phycisphaerales bacterium]|nr:MAG: GIY-YIG nuclease family protein [Phycisphaerales bacterium]